MFVILNVSTGAKEKGITLPQRRGPGGQDGSGDGKGPQGGDRRSGMRQNGPMSQLFTPEEQEQFRKNMQNAKTPEERAKARDAMHAAAEARAAWYAKR